MRLLDLRRELLHSIGGTDARIILRLATGFDDIHQLTESGAELTDEAVEKAREILQRRLSGTPMAYITGEKEFYGLPFRVSKDVLIPRPDTETLVDAVLSLLPPCPSPRILDLCTGSGAVAVALAHVTGLDVSMSDISPAALETAKENYRRNIGREPDARLGSLFQPWRGTRFDIIAANPPYLTEAWYDETEADVKAEPRLALIGGDEDGLAIIRDIAAGAADYLADNGAIAIECDYRQAASCAKILRNEGFSEIAVEKDAAGKERVVHGRRLS